MEKNNKLLAWLFAVIALVSIAGFYRSYLSKIPDVSQFYFVTHLHLILFLLWFGLVITQPILIRNKQFELHRTLGRFSYFLAPLLVFSILALVYDALPRNYANSPEDAAVRSVGGILDTITFSLCYAIAMVKKNNLRWHVAFILGASLIVLNPGLGRLMGNLVGDGAGILAMIATPFAFAFTILLYEKFKLERPMLKSPYLLYAFIWLCELVLFIVLPQTAFWKAAMRFVING
ncbi:hypothetical protein [Flavobacterium selenitireducens]|uniref:hypothetical protein n=1 Tax=Flavobacterium selenitireducens TaxID=2722704 RepID=UPI00168B2B2D|nr:hypothetical protein [Flavobacterium selenitireducens]MBD3583191.1 hypothetical protein [Flavobacterium selenitireducens]